MTARTAPDRVALTDILKLVKVDAKIARRRLRTAKVHKTVDGWIFKSAKVAQIKQIVKG